MYSTVVPPDPRCHVWDFWYHYEDEKFHLFYLNADKDLVASEEHHFVAKVGYASTKDFIRIDWGNTDTLVANAGGWDNTSIWSGDVIKVSNGYVFFYTSRDHNQDDGMTQNIGIAFAPRLYSGMEWKRPRTEVRIKPNMGSRNSIYLEKGLVGDRSKHAWRDPFLFRWDDQIYMLVCAKTYTQPLCKNGAISLLRLQDKNNLADWEALEPISSPGEYSEMEVPQIYRDTDGKFELVFSSWARNDFSEATRHAGGLIGLTSDSWDNYQGALPHVLLSEESRLYACRIVPELNGEIIGFDTKYGGIRRSGVQTRLQSVNRNFTDITWSL